MTELTPSRPETDPHPLGDTLRELLEWRNIALPLAAVAILIGVSRWHYLAFHALAELFAVVVAIATSAVAWYTYRFTRNHLLMFLGAGMFWIGILDLLHTLTFRGMPDAFGANANHATQFWIATRYLEALLLLAAPSFHQRPLMRLPLFLLFGALALGAAGLIMGGLFPDAFVEGLGLTPFKVASEYLIIALLLIAIRRYYRIREETGRRLFHFMAATLVLTVSAEFCFTLYSDPYGLFNLVGHICKLLAFWLLFLAMVRMPLEELLTSAERSRESERRYRQLFSDCAAVELLIDPADGRIVDANRAAAGYYGWSMERLRSMRITDINTLTPEEVAAEMERAKREERSHFFFRHRLAGGEIREVEVHSGPLELEGRRILYSIIHDITARRRVEAELVHARRAAESANRAKSVFLAAMSHELRTPLNAVLGFAQLLERDPRLDEGQLSQARAIHHSGNHLLSLITEVLDLAKIEAGRLEIAPEPCDLPGLLQGLVEAAGVRAMEKGLELRFDPDPSIAAVVRVDERRLRQVAANLLSNAVKFTHRGFVALHARLDPGEGNARRLWLEVEDTGVGIAASELESIFEPFRQVGSDDRLKAQGTGLGLAIVRQLVRLQGGELRVESEPGKGSCFQVEIPVTRLGAGAIIVPLEGLAGRVSGYRRSLGEGDLELLVVDDAADTREFLIQLLRPLGFQLREAADGRECLAAVRERRPDAVLLDLRMPAMDGFAAARALRADPALAGLPLLAISAGAFEEDQAEALAAGCDAFLSKPLQLDPLLKTLARLLPLEWIRGPGTNRPGPIHNLPGTELAREQLDALRHALRKGDVRKIQVLLESHASAPDASPRTRELLELARGFRMRDLQRRLAAMDDG